MHFYRGKFGQRQNLPQTKIVNDPKELIKLICNPSSVMNDFNILSEDLLMVSHEYNDSFLPVDTTTNVYVAAFTTAYARLKLYDILNELDRRVLYCDTDSVIYTATGNQKQLQLGDYLGELTNELSENEHITDFVSAGPKLYAFKTNKGNTVCKVRGFTLNYEASQQINFETVRRDILNGAVISIRTNNIVREKCSSRVLNKLIDKKCRKVIDKRLVKNNNIAFPFGY